MKRRQAQKTRLENGLQVLAVNNKLHTLAATASGMVCAPQSAAELATLVADNNSKLTSCWQLLTAFQETQRARDAFQACLEREDELLNGLDKPAHHSLQLSLQAVDSAATKLRLDDPQREQRHTEMLLRCTVVEGVTWCFCIVYCTSTHAHFM